MAREVYEYLGREIRRSQRADDREEQPIVIAVPPALAEAINELKREPCIWDGRTERFWPPEHTFAHPVPFFGDLRVHVTGRELEIDGLDTLGRRGEPQVDDFASFLRDLYRAYVGDPLPEEPRKQALHALRQFEPIRDSALLVTDLPVLCSDGTLRRADEVLVDDAPWWRDRLVAAPTLAWLHHQVDTELALLAGAVRASASVSEVLLHHEESMGGQLQRWCNERQRVISSTEFCSGLLRLLAHERSASAHAVILEAGSLQERLRLRMHACSVLRTGLVFEERGDEKHFGDAEVASFLDESGSVPRLLIAADDPEEAIPALAGAINRRLGDLHLQDLAPLESILRCQPEQIDTRLDQRRIPKVSAVLEPPVFDWDDREEPSEMELAAGTEEAFAEGPQCAEPDDDVDEGVDKGERPQPPGITRASSGVTRASGGHGDTAGVQEQGMATSQLARGVEIGPSEVGIGAARSNAGTARSGGSEPAPPSRTEPVVLKPANHAWSREGPHAPVSADRPPLEPGVGQSGGKASRTKGRLRSYLVPATGDTATGDHGSNRVTTEVENAAVERVVAEEEARGHVVQRMHRQNEGFDLTVTVEGESEIRIVEVKGLRAEWDARGVSLTPPEFRAAQKFASRYWLVVVEFTLDPRAVKVTRIQDPAGAVTEFRLDDGWRSLNEPTGPLAVPTVGMSLLTTQGSPLGTIEEVKKHGAAYLLILRTQTGRTQMAFNPSMHLLSNGVSGGGTLDSGSD